MEKERYSLLLLLVVVVKVVFMRWLKRRAWMGESVRDGLDSVRMRVAGSIVDVL